MQQTDDSRACGRLSVWLSVFPREGYLLRSAPSLCRPWIDSICPAGSRDLSNHRLAAHWLGNGTFDRGKAAVLVATDRRRGPTSVVLCTRDVQPPCHTGYERPVVLRDMGCFCRRTRFDSCRWAPRYSRHVYAFGRGVGYRLCSHPRNCFFSPFMGLDPGQKDRRWRA